LGLVVAGWVDLVEVATVQQGSSPEGDRNC
jgi:hypothetical protein